MSRWRPERAVGSVVSDPRLFGYACMLVTVETLVLVAATRGLDLGGLPGPAESWRVPAVLLGWALFASVPAALVAEQFRQQSVDGTHESGPCLPALRRTVAATVVAHLVLVAWWFSLTVVTLVTVVLVGTAADVTLGHASLVMWRHGLKAVAWVPFLGTLAAVPLVGFAGQFARTCDVSPRRAWRESLRSRLSSRQRTFAYALVLFSVLWLPLLLVGLALLTGSGPLGYLGGALVLLLPRLLAISLRVTQFEARRNERQDSQPVGAIRDWLAGIGGVALAVLLLSGSLLGVVRVADVHVTGDETATVAVEGKSADELIVTATETLDRVDHRVVVTGPDDDRSLHRYDHDDEQVLMVRNGTGPEGRTVGVFYGDENTFASCYQETTGFNPAPEACRSIDVQSFDLGDVTGNWTVETGPGYRRITEEWELRPPVLSNRSIDWRVQTRTDERLVLVAENPSVLRWTEGARVVLDRETGYLRRLVTTRPDSFVNGTDRTVYRFRDYGDVDVSRPVDVPRTGLASLYWDLATY
ncbi:hypothetical protein ACOZ4N_17190 [Halorientalis pallida]|uniref:hypothetical protein n=1 Tax=Halorientalis pallida TaxID=2479928 RepID=UPI003C6F2C58